MPHCGTCGLQNFLAPGSGNFTVLAIFYGAGGQSYLINHHSVCKFIVNFFSLHRREEGCFATGDLAKLGNFAKMFFVIPDHGEKTFCCTDGRTDGQMES